MILSNKSIIFAVGKSNFKHYPMEAKSVTEPYIPKNVKINLNPATAKKLGDAYFISLIEEGLKSEKVSLEELMRVLD